MEIIKCKNGESSELVLINELGDKFIIHYAGLDLYFTMLDYKEENKFIIRQNDELFLEFENLFQEIKNHDKQIPKLINNDCFTWISESYGIYENQNKLNILKEDDKFIIKFYQNPNREFIRKDICPICFCLSGSKNQNVANLFSIMFQELIILLNSKTKILNKKV